MDPLKPEVMHWRLRRSHKILLALVVALAGMIAGATLDQDGRAPAPYTARSWCGDGEHVEAVGPTGDLTCAKPGETTYRDLSIEDGHGTSTTGITNSSSSDTLPPSSTQPPQTAELTCDAGRCVGHYYPVTFPVVAQCEGLVPIDGSLGGTFVTSKVTRTTIEMVPGKEVLSGRLRVVRPFSTCAIIFDSPYKRPPACTVMMGNPQPRLERGAFVYPGVMLSGVSADGFQIVSSGLRAGDIVNYRCASERP